MLPTDHPFAWLRLLVSFDITWRDGETALTRDGRRALVHTRFHLPSVIYIVMKSFDTKDCNDLEVSSRKFESFDTKVSEVNEIDNGIPEVSSGNFESFDTKDCENSEVSMKIQKEQQIFLWK